MQLHFLHINRTLIRLYKCDRQIHINIIKLRICCILIYLVCLQNSSEMVETGIENCQVSAQNLRRQVGQHCHSNTQSYSQSNPQYSLTDPHMCTYMECSMSAKSDTANMQVSRAPRPYTYTGISCTHRQQKKNWPLFSDFLQFNCCAYAVLIKDMSVKFNLINGKQP